MTFLAVLRDSFRETLECKTLWILLAVSALLILSCAGLSFEALSPEEAVKDVARDFSILTRGRGRNAVAKEYPVTFQVEGVRTGEDGWTEFGLRVSPAKEFHRLLRRWDAWQKGEALAENASVPDAEEPADFQLQRRYLRERFRLQQLVRASIEPDVVGEGSLAYRVRIRPSRPELLRGAHRMSTFFGLQSKRLGNSVAMVVVGIELQLAQLVVGLIGIFLAIIATASFVPDMLQKGRLDLVLSKPVGRARLLLYKYVGGLLFVALNAAILIGGCWLALAVRSGRWEPSFLMSIPILIFQFAILYSFSVWIGVMTRSVTGSILATALLWVASMGVGAQRGGAVLSGWAARVLDAFYVVLPKAADLMVIDVRFIMTGGLGAEEYAASPQGMATPEVDAVMVIATSLVFVAGCLVLACATFRRRDY